MTSYVVYDDIADKPLPGTYATVDEANDALGALVADLEPTEEAPFAVSVREAP